MSFHKPNGKDRFIMLMAAGIINRGSVITEAQFKDAKTLFLAKAYNADPAVVERLTNKLKGELVA